MIQSVPQIRHAPKSIRILWRPPERMDPVRWANEYIFMPKEIATVSKKWSEFHYPYQAGVIEAFFEPGIEKIVMKWGTQLGKTVVLLSILNIIAGNRPAPAIIITATRDSAKKFSQTRLYPMFKASPIIGAKLPPEHKQQDYFVSLDSMPIYIGWSGSEISTAETTTKYIFCSEVDKWSRKASLESDPLELIKERRKAYISGFKILMEGTPTIDGISRIDNEYKESDRRSYHVPCPYCGEFQALSMGQIKGGKDKDGITRSPQEARKHAYYECLKCNKAIHDSHKMEMLRGGKWVREGQEVQKNGKIIGEPANPGRTAGFHLSSVYSNAISFGEMLQNFLEVRKDPIKLQNFVNSWLADTWKEKVDETEPDVIASLAETYPAGMVPAGVRVLTAGVDTQKDHHWFVIRGWGYGEESWLIRQGRAESWQHVVQELFQTQYKRVDTDETLGIRLALFDSGYRTDEVYQVCRANMDRARATKGHQTLPGHPWKITHVDKDPNTGKTLQGSVSLVHVDTHYFKDKIMRLVNTDPGSLGAWHLHEEPEYEYLRQFCSEHKALVRDRKTGKHKYIWRLNAGSTDNHLWDCEVLAVVAAALIGVPAMRAEGEVGVYKPKPKRQRERKASRW